MKIKKFCGPLHCEECNKLKAEIYVISPDKTIIDSKMYLCDDCLQELNRKIVEHLAKKNI